MDLNAKTLESLNTLYSMAYNQAYNAVESCYARFCMVDTANVSVIEFPFIEAFAKMRQWLGDRHIKNLKAKMLRVVERAFEDTIGVSCRAVETDQYGVYKIHIGQMGQNAGNLWDDLFIEALTANAKWIDGKDFFLAATSGAGARKWGKNAIVNKTVLPLSVDSFDTAYDGMMEWDGHNKEPLAVVADVLMVGPANRKNSFNIVKNKFSADKTDNPNVDIVDVVINPRLIGDYKNYWFLGSTKGVMKPCIMHKAKESGMTENEANKFMQGKLLYGTDSYGECALAMPHLMYGGFCPAG